MKRRQLLIAGTLGAIGFSRALAQARPVKVGMLVPRPLTESELAPGIVARLAELGYRDGERMTFEYRSTDGVADRFAKFARDLVELKCDLIFIIGSSAQDIKTMRDLRSSIPVVFLTVGADPLEHGMVANLGKPEGNITGVYVPEAVLAAKRLDILREIVPGARRFLVFSDPFTSEQLSAAVKAAKASGVELTIVEFSKQPYDYGGALESGRRAGAQGFLYFVSPVFARDRAEVAGLLVKAQLPSITNAVFAPGGFLIGYGILNLKKLADRTAEIGVRILKGTKPVEIPVEQFDEVELIINAKTARALGVRIPESIMARATRIVQ